jgi:two-component system cell cycle response regulator DivK
LTGVILIAEDNNDCREMMALVFRRFGYDVIEAKDGLQAIDQALSKNPDLIIMDLRMPKLDGLEATRRLKENLLTKNIPIIICTATHKEADTCVGVTDYCAEIVRKPVGLQTLRELVQKYIRGRNMSLSAT